MKKFTRIAAFLLGALMNNQPLVQAAATALDFTHSSIRATLQSGEPLRYGVQFESVLPEYWSQLHTSV